MLNNKDSKLSNIDLKTQEQFDILKNITNKSCTFQELVNLTETNDGTLTRQLKHLIENELINKTDEGVYKATELGRKIANFENFFDFKKMQKQTEEEKLKEQTQKIVEETIQNFGWVLKRQLQEAREYIMDYIWAVSKGDLEKSAEAQNILQELKEMDNRIKTYDELLKSDIDTRKIGLKDVVHYVNNFTGYNDEINFYPNVTALVSLAQSIAVAGFQIKLPDNRILYSAFHQANIGAAQTGKSFNTKTLLLGKEDKAIPPVGVPLIRTGIESMSTPAFVVFLYLHEITPFRWVYINDEFSDWIKQDRELQNKLKIALEFEPVSWKLKVKASIPEFRPKGAFILNCNDFYRQDLGVNSVNADVQALLSRSAVQGWSNTKSISRFIRSRTITINKRDALKLRVFLTRIYHKIFCNNVIVEWDEESYNKFNIAIDQYEDYLTAIAGTPDFDLEFGIREKETAIKYASTLAIIDNLLKSKNCRIKITPEAVALGLDMLFEQLKARQPTVHRKHLHYDVQGHKPMTVMDLLRIIKDTGAKKPHQIFN